MNRLFPVYTIANECQDCYKCVRHCHCKAIRIENGRAAVIPERCVSCGECVKVCPAHAKKIRSDAARLRQLLDAGATVYASIAPSFVGYFPHVAPGQLAAALHKLGLAGASETAHGAQVVSAATARYVEAAPDGVYISSACPAAVSFIRKYLPAQAANIVPFDSPVLAHAKLLRKRFGESIKVAFFGPCAAKKGEADEHEKNLDMALTFQELEQLFKDREIDPARLAPEPLALGPAEEGRVYSLEGGMLDTLRNPHSNIRYIAVSGLAKLDVLLRHGLDGAAGKLFIEALGCEGGCVNGPAMSGSAGVETLLATSALGGHGNSLDRPIDVDIHHGYFPNAAPLERPGEADLEKALASVGKFTKADELNCGACGYDSCRDFARALLSGKAESAMCHNFLRQNFQRTSNALIRYIPSGVVIVDEKLTVLEANRHFAELLDESTLTIYDNLGTLAGIELANLIGFADLFESVLSNGGEITRFNQVLNSRIVNLSIFPITPGKTAGAVIQDVTQSELRREQIAEKAKEVIRKNVLTVQEVARLFGEHIAESEILLEEIAGSYCAPGDPARNAASFDDDPPGSAPNAQE